MTKTSGAAVALGVKRRSMVARYGGHERHVGTSADADQHRFPLPLPVPPYSSREAEAGSPLDAQMPCSRPHQKKRDILLS
jgi:hypothetical protein